MIDLPEVLTPKQLADFIGVSERSLAQDRYLKKGLPYIKLDQKVRYMRADVEAYLEANRVSVGETAS
jgi:hypothetical protein